MVAQQEQAYASFLQAVLLCMVLDEEYRFAQEEVALVSTFTQYERAKRYLEVFKAYWSGGSNYGNEYSLPEGLPASLSDEHKAIVIIESALRCYDLTSQSP